ncbi:MAG TPA: hypothetical protein VFK40_07110 [Nitrososphaeraceae archaeon]|nr:hypothetical protein [Nitrososphaeraceae archaeon]
MINANPGGIFPSGSIQPEFIYFSPPVITQLEFGNRMVILLPVESITVGLYTLALSTIIFVVALLSLSIFCCYYLVIIIVLHLD